MVEKICDKAVEVANDNIAIEFIREKCINCGLCKKNCIEREGIEDLKAGKMCTYCGQCAQICPVGAIRPKCDIDKLKWALKNKKNCIVYIAPAVRTAIGESFGMEYGTFVQGKIISALRKIGFKYVFDVTTGADLTILEEANELVDRIKNQGDLPMFTSCCPSWVKYVEQYYPDLLTNLSTCKSPIAMLGAIVDKYFIPKRKLEDTYTVVITPCTSKKFEISRDEIEGTDLVITTLELIEYFKEIDIDLASIEESQFDLLLGEGSGSGMIFGGTGGVMTAALRTAYKSMTGNELDNDAIEFNEIRGMENVKEAVIDMKETKIRVAVVHKMSSAKQILEDVRNGVSKYDYIEIMNCYGGCVGGGGQPKLKLNQENEIKGRRINALNLRDRENSIRKSHENINALKIYEDFLEKPLSDKAFEMLHTLYEDKSK